MPCERYDFPYSRRQFLQRAGGGFGAVALSALTGERLLAAESANPAAAKIPHHLGKAKNVIFLFMEGGPSHIDLFDPKPLLNKLAGQSLPDSFERPVTAMGEVNSPLLASKRTWKQHGESGLWISDWLPQHAHIADDLCVIRSCVSDGINHAGGVCQMNTGSVFGGRPSLGAWVSYGLGTLNQDMPGFVVIKDTDAMIVNGVRCWGAGFMPASYQGVLLENGDEPIANLRPAETSPEIRQAGTLKFLRQLNEQHVRGREYNTELEARIRSYELAYRMQSVAPEAVALEQESESTKALYGMEDKESEVFGRNCLLRVDWLSGEYDLQGTMVPVVRDAHSGIEENHAKLCHQVDQPIVGLIEDLKQRGLLDETLVIWGGEFGRTPMSEKEQGAIIIPPVLRCIWLEEGQGGQTIGETDELGLFAVSENFMCTYPCHDSCHARSRSH